MPLNGLDGKVFIVTAAGSGIGLALSRRLAEEGARVVMGDIAEEAVRAAADELGGSAVAVAVDSGSPEAMPRLFSAGLERFGTVDGLANNAGITAPRVPIVEVEMGDFERIIRVNVLGTFAGIQAMLRHAASVGARATVVNTASGIALRAAPHHSIYAATKSAVISLTRTAAVEGAPLGVRVNALLPGPTATPTLLSASAEKQAGYLSAVPFGRLGTPEEVASAGAWLLSGESEFVTGITVQVDGGQTA